MRADRVGIFRHLGKAGGRDHLGIAHCGLVRRAILLLDQLHQLEPAAALLQPLQGGDLEALDEHRILRRDPQLPELAQQQIYKIDTVVLEQEFGVL